MLVKRDECLILICESRLLLVCIINARYIVSSNFHE